VKSLSLYIHVPFCADTQNFSGKCDYCDFYSVIPENSEIISAFLNAVIIDINNQIKFFNVDDVPTVYIGGGTPSVLGKRIGILLDALKKIPNFSPVEITVEANPESAAEEFLCACKEGGVNRLSLGVQTFNEVSRKAVNRIGNVDMLRERIALCSKYFPSSLNVDLITGLPFQNEKIVCDDIKSVLIHNPAHISLYSLTVEKDTNFYKRLKKKEISLPDLETSDSLWLLAREILEQEGFNQYEVSNFAKGGKECLHNIRYWRMEGWLGIGPAASGTVVNEEEGTAKRFTYTPDVNAYIKNPFIGKAVCEEINKNDLLRESLLMGYRYVLGPDEEVFKKRFGCKIEDSIPQTISKWKGKDKMLFLNKFLTEAFNELDSQLGKSLLI
jgi:oxygen-independent coproporphyrinogen-3 oxidase